MYITLCDFHPTLLYLLIILYLFVVGIEPVIEHTEEQKLLLEKH